MGGSPSWIVFLGQIRWWRERSNGDGLLLEGGPAVEEQKQNTHRCKSRHDGEEEPRALGF